MRDVLVKTFNLAAASKEEQDAMIEKIGGLIFQAVLLRVAPTMSEETQNKLEKMLDENASPEELLGFLNTEVPHFNDIVAEEATNFKNESDAIMSQVKG